jgi:hypothetical protein
MAASKSAASSSAPGSVSARASASMKLLYGRAYIRAKARKARRRAPPARGAAGLAVLFFWGVRVYGIWLVICCGPGQGSRVWLIGTKGRAAETPSAFLCGGLPLLRRANSRSDKQPQHAGQRTGFESRKPLDLNSQIVRELEANPSLGWCRRFQHCSYIAQIAAARPDRKQRVFRFFCPGRLAFLCQSFALSCCSDLARTARHRLTGAFQVCPECPGHQLEKQRGRHAIRAGR